MEETPKRAFRRDAKPAVSQRRKLIPKLRKSIVAKAPAVKKPQPRALPTVWNRRASYEMDIDWDSIGEDVQKIELAMRLGVPVNDLKSISKNGSIVHLSVDIKNARLHASRSLLYRDVGDDGEPGLLYQPHTPLLEPDPYIGPYWPADHAKELSRAESLSYEPISDAPPASMNLPWDELLAPDRMITIEEFLVYFPNHVAQWPGLAAILRWKNLDRLFYRAARIINLARGSHFSVNREHRHIEVLPLQMKIERAIKEIHPTYSVFDFNHGDFSEQTIINHLKQRPREQNERPTTTCSLSDAAACIIGVNEFDSFSPFSRYMKQFHPRITHLKPPATPNGTGGMGSLQDYTYTTNPGFVRPTFLIKDQPPYPNVVQDDFPTTEEPADPSICSCPTCADPDCKGEHRSPLRIDQTGPYPDNVSDSDVDQPSIDVDVLKKLCSSNEKCMVKQCAFAHIGPWNNQNLELRIVQGECELDAECTDKICRRAHSSWAWLYDGKGPIGNTNGTNGKSHCAPWQTPCTFETRDAGCGKATCAFGHRGPRVAPGKKVDYKRLPRCPRDRGCKSVMCMQAHSSPVTEIEGRNNPRGRWRGAPRGIGRGRR